MPKISITNKDLDYGIYDAEIFWVKQGILTREAVRESRDEELVLDILLDMILDPLASSGSEYRNSAYGDERGPASTSSTAVRGRLLVLGPEEVERRFLDTLTLVIGTLETAGATYAQWTVTQQNQRGVPRHFHALVVALEQLTGQERLVPKSKDELATALKGFWDKDLTIPGGGNWGGKRKAELINAVKGYLRPHFVPTTDKHDLELHEQALTFEATLRMALTEQALIEFKQGFCKINGSNTFDSSSFAKILRSAAAMANSGPNTKGVIFIGVADDEGDARSIEKLQGITAEKIDQFFVSGTQHELDALGRSIDEHLRWLLDQIDNSQLDAAFARELGKTLTPFRYKGRLLWKLEPSAQREPVTYEGKFYERKGPTTIEISNHQEIVALGRRFPQ